MPVPTYVPVSPCRLSQHTAYCMLYNQLQKLWLPWCSNVIKAQSSTVPSLVSILAHAAACKHAQWHLTSEILLWLQGQQASTLTMPAVAAAAACAEWFVCSRCLPQHHTG